MKKRRIGILFVFVLLIVCMLVSAVGCSRNQKNVIVGKMMLNKGYSYYDYEDEYRAAAFTSFLIYAIAFLLNGAIFGYIAKTVAENREIEPKTAFWWGFWLGLIGLIVVLSKPERKTQHSSNSPSYAPTKSVLSHTPPRTNNKKKESVELLSKINKNVVLKDGPLEYRSTELMKGTGNEIYILNTFKNISEKQISALQLSIEGRDPFGTITDSLPAFSYIDLKVQPGEVFGKDKKIVLGSGSARNVDVDVKAVIFSDGTRWDNTGAGWEEKVVTNQLVFSDIEEILQDKKNGAEILSYLESQDYENEVDEALEEIRKVVQMEKIYGNQKNQVIKILRDKF